MIMKIKQNKIKTVEIIKAFEVISTMVVPSNGKFLASWYENWYKNFESFGMPKVLSTKELKKHYGDKLLFFKEDDGVNTKVFKIWKSSINLLSRFEVVKNSTSEFPIPTLKRL